MSDASNIVADGLQHQQAGRLAEAATRYRAVLRLEPDHVDALHLLGVVSLQTHDHDAARELIGRASLLRPDNAAILCNLCEAHRRAGALAEAAVCGRRAVGLNRAFAEAHHNLGVVLSALGESDDAVAHLEQAVSLKPDRASWLRSLGNALRRHGALERAETALIGAIALGQDDAETHNALGATLREQRRLDDAEASVRKALELRPAHAHAWTNLAAVLRDRGDLAAAEEAARRAVRLDGTLGEARDALGAILLALDRRDDALRQFDAAIAIDPSHANAHRNRGLAWLTAGDYRRGFDEYEWRLRANPALARHRQRPRWRGEALDGRTILLWTEQGLGDTIQFLRFAHLLSKDAGRVIVECQPALAGIARTAPGVDEVVAMHGSGGATIASDVHAPLLSLPHLLGLTLVAVPASVPYIEPEATLRARCRALLDDEQRDGDTDRNTRIGLCWQGNPRFVNDRLRSIPLAALTSLMAVPRTSWYSLQHGPGHEQLDAVSGDTRVRDLAAHLDDAASAIGGDDEGDARLRLTAAAVAELDLVITSDTMVAHLAGALGRPVWVLLGPSPDWRWLRNRADSPWYPTMRLFRRQHDEDWSDVVARVGVALREMLAGSPHGGSKAMAEAASRA